MSTQRNTLLSRRVIDACLLVAVLGTLWHIAASRVLGQNDEPIGPIMNAGVRVPIPELWESAGAERTAILVLDLDCAASLPSRPFYGELSRVVADTPGSRLLVLSESPIPVVRKWLDEGGVAGRVVRIPSRKTLGILATPTLLLANSEGVVTDISIGMGGRADSDRFKARLRGESDLQPVRLPYSVTEVSVRRQPDVDRWIGPQLIDVRDTTAFARAHSAGALNIPERELKVRARTELRRSLPVFIDCRYSNQAECRVTGAWLGSQGFSSVTVVLQ